MKRKHAIALGAGVVALVILAAGASALVTQKVIEDKPAVEKTAAAPKHKTAKSEKITWNEPRQAQPAQQAQAAPASCDDYNIVGIGLGAVAGGVAGNQIGSGRGQDLATIGGALGGAYLGKQYIPTHNVTCR